MNCPNCGAECECDSIDIGIGAEQSGPWFCTECEWSEDNRIDMDILEEDKEDE